MIAKQVPGDEGKRQAFVDSLESGEPALLPLCPGIQLCTLTLGTRQGLSLQIAREALQAGQLQRVLERRFEQAIAFAGCFPYLDSLGALVIWHALPASRSAREQAISRLLSLANLEALDKQRTR